MSNFYERNCMKKIKFLVISVWYLIVCFVSPYWLSQVFLCVSGHPKGFSYSVEHELGYYVALGIVLIILWINCFIPSAAWLCACIKKYKPKFKWLLIVAFAIMAVLNILVTGGFGKYILQFK